MYYLLLLVQFVRLFECARILCVFPTPFHSHQSFFRPIWHELAIRGHQVTVVTPNPIEKNCLGNLKQIDISFTYKLVFEELNTQHIINTETRFWKLLQHSLMVLQNATHQHLHHPNVQELLSSKDSYDLMIAEVHIPAWFGLAKRYNCPVIGISSTGSSASNHFKRFLGNIMNPVLTPNLNLPFGSTLTLPQRIFSFLWEFIDEYGRNLLIYPNQQQLIREALKDPTIDLLEIFRSHIRLFFINFIPGFDVATINLPSVIPLNGLQIESEGVLSDELQTFLDGATNGAIYFSMGSIVKSSLMSEQKRAIFFNVFCKLPFRVIWKYEDRIVGLSKKIKLISWAPQQDILRHKNTKLFITHGGKQSIEESIRFHVPMLGFPFFGDHFYNVERMKHLQLGTWLDLSTLTEERLIKSIFGTINNNVYLKNLQEISDLLDKPLSSLEKAVWWVEYVLKHRESKYLRSVLLDTPFYQYYLLDVAAFITVFILVTGLIVTRCITILKRKSMYNALKVHHL